MIEIREITKQSLEFEIKKEDNFSSVLNRYMAEQNISIAILSARTGINKNTLIDYRAGNHIPNDIHKLVALCIGLQINEHRAEYLISLAHMSIGYDVQGMAFRMLISLAFLTGITVCQGNMILDNLDLPTL